MLDIFRGKHLFSYNIFASYNILETIFLSKPIIPFLFLII
jgi:hypothetical protein